MDLLDVPLPDGLGAIRLAEESGAVAVESAVGAKKAAATAVGAGAAVRSVVGRAGSSA